jgi:hypothetical protein
MGPATSTYAKATQRETALLGHALAADGSALDDTFLAEVTRAATSEDEQSDMVELRYRQHLAQRAMQEVFESGDQRPLES